MIETVTKNYGINNEFCSYQVTYVNSNRVKSVPLDEANTDYQEYLKWVEAGNTPLAADNIDSGA